MTGSCSKCHQEFQPGEGILSALGEKWHTHCFVCRVCNKPFKGSYVLSDNSIPMHEACAKAQAEEEGGDCDICRKVLGVGIPIVELDDGSKYHQKCFVCGKCRKPFEGKSPYHVQKDHKPYHPDCIASESGEEMRKAVAPEKIEGSKRCDGCGKGIEGGFRIVPDVGNFHPKCFVCHSCQGNLETSFVIHPNTKKQTCKPCIEKWKKTLYGEGKHYPVIRN